MLLYTHFGCSSKQYRSLHRPTAQTEQYLKTSWKNLHICKTGHSNGGEWAVISSWRITPCILRLPSTWLSTSSQTFLVTRAQICWSRDIGTDNPSMLSLETGSIGRMCCIHPRGQSSCHGPVVLVLWVGTHLTRSVLNLTVTQPLGLSFVLHKLVAVVEVDNLLQAQYLDSRLQHI